MVSSDITVGMALDVPVQTVLDSDLVVMDPDMLAAMDSTTVVNSGVVVVVGSARVGSNMMPTVVSMSATDGQRDIDWLQAREADKHCWPACHSTRTTRWIRSRGTTEERGTYDSVPPMSSSVRLVLVSSALPSSVAPATPIELPATMRGGVAARKKWRT